MRSGPSAWIPIMTAICLWNCFSVSASETETEANLKWVDSSGNMVDLDWQSQVRWIWKQVPGAHSSVRTGAFAQVWIDLPPQLHLSVPDESPLRLLESADAGDGDGNEESSTSQLLLETQSPTNTAKLAVEEGDGLAQKAGLLITLDFETARILIHDSCRKEGLQLTRISGSANFLFVSAICQKEGNLLTIYLIPSEDAEALDKDGLRFQVALSSIKKNGGEYRLGRVKIANKLQAGSSEYSVDLNKSVETSGAHVSPGRLLKSEEKNSWTLLINASPSYFSYTGTAEGTAGNYSSVYNLVFALRASHPVKALGRSLEGEFLLPVMTVLPSPAVLPSSAVYQAAFRGPIPLVAISKSLKTFFYPGVTFEDVRLEHRSDAPGFLYGPEAVFGVNGLIPNLRNRTFEGRLGFAPLADKDSGLTFNNYKISALFLYGLRYFSWDMTLRADYMRLNPQINVTQVSLGLQLGY